MLGLSVLVVGLQIGTPALRRVPSIAMDARSDDKPMSAVFGGDSRYSSFTDSPSPYDPSKGGLLDQMAKALEEAMGGMAAFAYKPTMIDAFEEVAGSSDGFITAEQLGELLTKCGDEMPEEETAKMFKGVDMDEDGKIDYAQYYKLMIDEARARRDKNMGKTKSEGGGFKFPWS